MSNYNEIVKLNLGKLANFILAEMRDFSQKVFKKKIPSAKSVQKKIPSAKIVQKKIPSVKNVRKIIPSAQKSAPAP